MQNSSFEGLIDFVFPGEEGDMHFCGLAISSTVSALLDKPVHDVCANRLAKTSINSIGADVCVRA